MLGWLRLKALYCARMRGSTAHPQQPSGVASFTQLVINQVTWIWLPGPLVAIPEDINAVEMHRITWPQMGSFIRREVGAMLDVANNDLSTSQFVLEEAEVPYRAETIWQRAQRLAA